MKVGTLLKVGSMWDIACPKLVTNFKKYRGSFSVFEYSFGEYVRPGQKETGTDQTNPLSEASKTGFGGGTL